ncbi:hypothetical protein VTK56DRAFT_4929 [Thermocarpiscus australiensis]
MVKLDYDRDYYADLELPPLADVAEVKKQFKKLALRWHPDRNPGKEEEAKEKFLIIQAAHEILSDPNSKSKFDAYRQRTASSARYSGYPAASGVRGNPWQYTAQEVNQKFGAPPKRPPMPTRPAAPAGGTRYWDWAHRARTKPDNARANMEAWDRSRPQTKTNQSSGATPASGTRPSPAGTKPAEASAPRTAYQARRQEAAFGTSRKTGFAPASPMGDEPPVKNSNYNTHTNATSRESAHQSAPQTSKPRPTSAFANPPPTEFNETYVESRQRTPYAAYPGEKTNPFEPLNINRAKSMRDRGGRFQDGAGETPPDPPPRQRSASVGSDGFKRSTNEKPAFNEPKPPLGPQFPSRASARYSPQGTTPSSAPPTATYPTPNASASSANNGANATLNGAASAQATGGTKVFSVPLDDDEPITPGPQARFTRNSADNINTRFVDEEKSGASFQFSAGTPRAADDSFPRAKTRGRGGQSPLRNEFTSSSESAGAPTQNEAGKAQGGFVAEEWKEAFGPHVFVAPQPSKPSASPTRPIRPIKKPRPVRMTAGTAGIVDDEETSSEEEAKPSAAPGGINGDRSPNAMDIDTPPHPAAAPHANGARNINVEPTKPEWRAGNVDGVNADPKLGAGLKIPTVNPNAAGSEDSEEFMRPVFSEFANVEPLAQKPSGLGSFADMSSNLPFPSKPSAKIPLARDKARPVEVPQPPAAPRPPAGLVVPGTKPSSPAWTNYVREFEAYLKLWYEFNRKVTDHFVARQRLNEKKGLGWLRAVGEAGVQDYVRALEEDKYVRQKWMTACETHELHFREFLQHRERMVRQAL